MFIYKKPTRIADVWTLLRFIRTVLIE